MSEQEKTTVDAGSAEEVPLVVPPTVPDGRAANQETKPARRRISPRGFVLILLMLSIWAAWLMNKSWSVRKIVVEGNRFTSTEEILKIAQLAPGTKPDSVAALEIILRVEKLPYIAEARIEPNPPGSVKIVVIEREPVALLSNGSKHVILDNKGVKMPLIPGKVPDLPVLYGFSTGLRDTLAGHSFDTVCAFLKQLKTDPVASAMIGELSFDREKGIVAISQRSNVKLFFGHDEFAPRLRNLDAFYSQIVRTRGLTVFQWIDLRFSHQIVTKEST